MARRGGDQAASQVGRVTRGVMRRHGLAEQFADELDGIRSAGNRGRGRDADRGAPERLDPEAQPAEFRYSNFLIPQLETSLASRGALTHIKDIPDTPAEPLSTTYAKRQATRACRYESRESTFANYSVVSSTGVDGGLLCQGWVTSGLSPS